MDEKLQKDILDETFDKLRKSLWERYDPDHWFDLGNKS